MSHGFRSTLRGGPLATLLALATFAAAPAAEIVRVTPDNYDELTTLGKEIDAIFGDYVLKSDRLLVVVADTKPSRNANLTTHQIAGCVIDMTRVGAPSDQLTAYYPMDRQFGLTQTKILEGDGPAVVLECTTGGDGFRAAVRYTLRDGVDFLEVHQSFTNPQSAEKAEAFELRDQVRADTSFTKVDNGSTDLFWVADEWFGQAYGLVATGHAIDARSDSRRSRLAYQAEGGNQVELKPGESTELELKLFPASSLAGVRCIADSIAEQASPVVPCEVVVMDAHDLPVAHAMVSVEQEGEELGRVRTNGEGKVSLLLNPGDYAIEVDHPAYGKESAELEHKEYTTLRIGMPAPPTLIATITDGEGQTIPAKVQFVGVDGTENPDLGPTTQGPGVNNLYYSHDGKFELPLPAGTYDVIVTYGPEYDMARKTVTMKAGQKAPLNVSLPRVVETPGFVSSDLHSHSSPSGDNVTSVKGRVLNLLAEHLEFNPCTEHNRLYSYTPTLEELGAVERMATCVGLELTGRTLTLNHQNAFPLVLKPGEQDNGAPQVDNDPEVQIRRLAGWDNGAKKVVQTNHPDMGWMYFDRDGNGELDRGYEGMFPFQTVVEMWGNDKGSMLDEGILDFEPITDRGRNNRLFAWLQMLNLSRNLIAVGNSDAHYCDHGNGWVRNYVRSSTDDPTKVSIPEMIEEYTTGHVLITNGPYLEVSARSGAGDAIAGDDLVAPNGKLTLDIRVQCPNWFDIERVVVLKNGRIDPKLDFTRAKDPGLFSNSVVKFQKSLDLELEQDAHLIVVAIGPEGSFGIAYGEELKAMKPTAFNNPIFVDVDGNGFRANGDLLDQPPPVKQGLRKRASN